jgi:probable rRNA maturation factor
MKITIYNRQKDLPIPIPSIKKKVQLLLTHLDVETDEVILHFVSRKTICEVHAEHFSDPSPTDCMSFPIDPPQKKTEGFHPHLLGEIFICPSVAIEYASKRKQDPYQETLLYVVHGILHLLGYDDQTPSERKQMRKKEKECLMLLELSTSSRKKKKIV